MNSIEKLLEMKVAPGGSVWLYSSEFSRKWNCNFEGQVNDLRVKIENMMDTPDEAISATYATFSNLANSVKPLTSPLLMAPTASDFTEPPLPDEIPF